MGTYVTLTDLQGRLPYDLPAAWDSSLVIGEAEARLIGALVSIGAPGTGYSAAATLQIRSWCLDYVEGHARKAQAVSAADGDFNAGEPLIERFEARIKDILMNPTIYKAMLEVATLGASAGGSRLRSYQTNNTDDLTIENGDFDPIFKTGTTGMGGNF